MKHHFPVPGSCTFHLDIRYFRTPKGVHLHYSLHLLIVQAMYLVRTYLISFPIVRDLAAELMNTPLSN